MSSSSPSRRRLLAWAGGAVLSSASLPAGVLEWLPGFRRRDPSIHTQVFQLADVIELADRSICVRPFEIRQAGKPAPPDFAPFLGRALTWALPESVVYVEPQPAAGVEVLIEGRVDLFHRIGAQGLRTAISVAVYDVSEDTEFVLWNGVKKADWVRRFPTDDCLLRLADDFVATWSPDYE